MEKTCFKCGCIKSVEDFYKHKKMADGRLGKCKECTKKDVKLVYQKNVKDESWMDKERKRYRRRKRKTTFMVHPNISRIYRDRYPEKRLARNASQRIPRNDGEHNHHWSYNKEHHRDVIQLSCANHHKAHRFMVYDNERLMYRRSDTMELLDSKEKHLAYITFKIMTEDD